MAEETQAKDNEYWVDFNIYQVSDELDHVDDDDWYEYRVVLMKGDDTLDMWDSRVETYNDVEGQRLSFEGARDAVGSIKQEVEQTQNPSTWFDNY